MYQLFTIMLALLIGQTAYSQELEVKTDKNADVSLIDSINLNYSQDSTHCVRGRPGPRGFTGPAGPIGPTGITGVTGATGVSGASGQTVNQNFASLKLVGPFVSFPAGNNINFASPNSANVFGGNVFYDGFSGEVLVTTAGNYLVTYGITSNTVGGGDVAQILVNGSAVSNTSVATAATGQLSSQSVIVPVSLIDGVGAISLQAVTAVNLFAFSNNPFIVPTIAFLEVVQLN